MRLIPINLSSPKLHQYVRAGYMYQVEIEGGCFKAECVPDILGGLWLCDSAHRVHISDVKCLHHLNYLLPKSKK